MRFAILGDPVGHSLSPPMQRAAFAAAGLTADYVKLPTTIGQLRPRIDDLRSGNWTGFNVTIPHKRAALALADVIEPGARAVGAANTLWCRGSAVHASNTDLLAVESILDDAQIEPDDHVLILGAGGAARAALYAVKDYRRVTVANRTFTHAQSLTSEIAPNARALPLSDENLARVAAKARLVINATSIGMAGGPDPESSPLPVDALTRGQTVLDMVYRPLETPLLAAARRAGANVIDGLTMLVLQGAASFEIWTGRAADPVVMRSACEDAL